MSGPAPEAAAFVHLSNSCSSAGPQGWNQADPKQSLQRGPGALQTQGPPKNRGSKEGTKPQVWDSSTEEPLCAPHRITGKAWKESRNEGRFMLRAAARVIYGCAQSIDKESLLLLRTQYSNEEQQKQTPEVPKSPADTAVPGASPVPWL